MKGSGGTMVPIRGKGIHDTAAPENTGDDR